MQNRTWSSCCSVNFPFASCQDAIINIKYQKVRPTRLQCLLMSIHYVISCPSLLVQHCAKVNLLAALLSIASTPSPVAKECQEICFAHRILQVFSFSSRTGPSFGHSITIPGKELRNPWDGQLQPIRSMRVDLLSQLNSNQSDILQNEKNKEQFACIINSCTTPEPRGHS